MLTVSDNDFYMPGIGRQTDAALSKAIECFDDTEKAESILLDAKADAPDELGAFVALYKFYFYKGMFEKALTVANETLIKAAEEGGFSSDWNTLAYSDFNKLGTESPQRVFLYTMKAVGFIQLRLENCTASKAILQKLYEFDPLDEVGGSVIMQLADRVCSN